MDKLQIKIENIKASIIISDLRCVDWPGDPKMHIGFNVEFDSFDYKFSTDFSEMFYSQFEFKRGVNQIIDECYPEKRLIIGKDEVCLQIKTDPTELANTQVAFSIKVDSDKLDDFKTELRACVEYVLQKK